MKEEEDWFTRGKEERYERDVDHWIKNNQRWRLKDWLSSPIGTQPIENKRMDCSLFQKKKHTKKINESRPLDLSNLR